MQEATILVVSPGRCASSFVAEILHRDLNIPMGRCFLSGDEHNPRGYWEDLYIQDLNDYLVMGKLKFYAFHNLVQKFIQVKNRDHAVWGLKNISVSMLIGYYLQFLRNPLFIRLHRNTDAQVCSYQRMFKRRMEYASKLFGCWGFDVTCESGIREKISYIETTLDKLLTGRGTDVLHLSFDERRDENYVVDNVADFLKVRLGSIPARKAADPIFCRKYRLNLMTGGVEGAGWTATKENVDKFVREKGWTAK